MKEIQGKLILVQVSMKFTLQVRVKNKIPVCKTKDQPTVIIINNHHMQWSLHEQNELTLVLKIKFTSPDKFCNKFVVTIKDL